MNLIVRWVVLIALELLAAPVTLFFAVRRGITFLRGAKLMRTGYITCPHCRETNALDLLATCSKCHTTEYGNRLRCTACGQQKRSFDCDFCGVTIRVL